jgi:DNA polymerase
MQIVTIDFETYYDKDYSLSKMTTEAYVNDPRFEVIGVGVKVGDGPTDWYSGSDVGGFLRSMDYSDKAILCHNTVFDGSILAWKYGINPRLWLDTLSMARPLHNVEVGGSLRMLAAHYKLGNKGTEVENALGKRRADFSPKDLEQYGQYCCNDVDLTYGLWMKMKERFPRQELIAIDLTIRMFTEPKIVLDKEKLIEHLEEVKATKAKLLAKVMQDPEELSSNVKFAALLRKLGIDPPTKTSKTTGKITYAFAKDDEGMQELLDHPDPVVQAVVAARVGVKSTLEETRTTSLLEVAERGPLPILLNYYKAHTGRYTGGDKLNLQNLPKRTNNKIRMALTAPSGYVFVAADSSQIEARVLAWLADDKELLQGFREKRDVYSEFASKIYGRTITKDNKVERFVGKTCILGLGYGMGDERLQRTLEIGAGGVKVKLERHETKRIVSIYRSERHKVESLWRLCEAMLDNMVRGYSATLVQKLPYSPDSGILLPSGFHMKYHMLNRTLDGYRYINNNRVLLKLVKERILGKDVMKMEDIPWTYIYGGKVTENLVQALAAAVIRQQMVKARLRGLHNAFQVHDEIVLLVPEDKADWAETQLVEIMSTPPDWAPDIPIACESGRGYSYGEV